MDYQLDGVGSRMVQVLVIAGLDRVAGTGGRFELSHVLSPLFYFCF